MPLYIIRTTFKLNGSLDREIFERSLEKLFRRHHVVFSVIKEVDSEPYCDILPTEVAIPFKDLTNLPEQEKSGRLRDILDEDSKKGFDLEKRSVIPVAADKDS